MLVPSRMKLICMLVALGEGQDIAERLCISYKENMLSHALHAVAARQR
jgi:hypothetical protein